MKEQLQPDRDLTAEACRWTAVIAIDEVGELERHRFAAWLKESPEHAAAYREACRALGHPMIAAAMAQAVDDRTREDARAPRWFPASWISRTRATRNRIAMAGLAATALVAMWSILLFQFSATPLRTPGQAVTAEHTTVGAETREIELPDGSFATLGARSAVSVSFTAGERRVVLREGEGYFAVAADSSRPFIVHAGSTTVRAVGTAFDVRLAVDSVRVDVVEGQVRVQSRAPAGTAPNAPASPMIAINASAGERLIFDPEEGLTKRPKVPDAGLAAWRTGRLEYFGEELSRVVADANRYYDGDIMIVSDDIKKLKVTASFPTSSAEHVFELLVDQVPITVSRTDQGDILIGAREGES